jgi:hypothetical protein
MDRQHFYPSCVGKVTLDCELYLNTANLLRYQKDYSELCKWG